MAEIVPHLPDIMSTRISVAIASAISTQIGTLIPAILKELTPALESNSHAGEGRDLPLADTTHLIENSNMSAPCHDHRELLNIPKPSFKEVLLPSDHDVDASPPMHTQRKGEYLSIKVDNTLVQRNISLLQNSLIGKLTLAQGDAPYSLESLKNKLG